MRVLVTGSAGFIGAAVSFSLLERGDWVCGLDNVNAYYDTSLKEARLDRLRPFDRFAFERGDVADWSCCARVFEQFRPECVVHLAAQAGVRYSIERPFLYEEANLRGFLNILEACRGSGVSHLLYASSSSVYGGNEKRPYAEDDGVDHPVSLYAATKKANELMAHAYSHLFSISSTGVRFFTVYGPWGRPDMALFRFTEAILAGQPIRLFGAGRLRRDFTFIDDVVACTLALLDRPPSATSDYDHKQPRPSHSSAPYRVVNIGNGSPVTVVECVELLSRALGVRYTAEHLPQQPGDAEATEADVSNLRQLTGLVPTTPLAGGIRQFVEWYRTYYRM